MFKGLLDRVRVDLVRSFFLARLWGLNNTPDRPMGETDQVSARLYCRTRSVIV